MEGRPHTDLENEQLKLEKLRHILMSSEREELESLRTDIHDPIRLAGLVDPLIDKKIIYLKENFPDHFGRQVNDLVETKIAASHDELVTVLYPVMGKMIKKYIGNEFQKLRESLEERISQTVNTPRRIFDTVKAKVFGVSESDMLLKSIDRYQIEEVYVIQAGSGLLLGSYSVNETLDRDLIAGMLTAIKSFVEDAFSRNQDELEMIHYGSYKLILQSFHKYYIVVAVSGTLTSADQDQISNLLLDFASQELKKDFSQVTSSQSDVLSMRLESYFSSQLHKAK